MLTVEGLWGPSCSVIISQSSCDSGMCDENLIRALPALDFISNYGGTDYSGPQVTSPHVYNSDEEMGSDHASEAKPFQKFGEMLLSVCSFHGAGPESLF